MPQLLDLVEQVLEARTGAAVENPSLTTLDVSPDPKITAASADRLAEFVGEWDYPPAPLGLSSLTTVRITAGDGHLVSYAPMAGTFRLYLQEDGTLHEEDSHELYVPVRDNAGTLAGIADVRTIVSGAVRAATAGQIDRATQLVALVDDVANVAAGVGRIVVDVLAGQESSADGAARQLAARYDANRVEMEINATGYALMQARQTEQALKVFELNTRVFPDAFNTWDSLGEALMNSGRDEEAIRAYERSLELNPENSNAETMISRIKSGRP